MAETLVLANLSIDSSGVVSGLSQSDRAMNKGEATLKRFGTTGLGTSTALRALGINLGGLGLAFGRLGPVAGAFAAAYLPISAIMRSKEVAAFRKEWEGISAAWGSAILQTYGLARAMNFLTGGLKEANAALTDPESLPEMMKRLGVADVQQNISDLTQLFGALNRELKSGAITANDYAIFLKQIGDKVKGLKEAGGLVPGGLAALIPPEKRKAPPTPFQTAGIASPAEVVAQLSQVKAAIQAISAAQHSGAISIDLYNTGIENLQGSLVKIGLTGEQIATVFHQFGAELLDVTPKFSEGQIAISDFADTLDRTQLFMEAFTLALNQLGDALATSLVEGGSNLKKAIANILKDLARMFITYGLAQLALGIMASTPWGAAVLGEPSGYFRAAAAAFAVGIAAGVASRAVSGTGGGSGGGGRSGGGRGLALAGAGGGQSVTIVIQGSLIGTDPDNLARDLRKLMRTAEAEGA